MKKPNSTLFLATTLFTAVLALSSCDFINGIINKDKDTEEPDIDTVLINNNSALLTGENIGRAFYDNSRLSKTIPVTLEVQSIDFELGEAVLSRMDPFSSYSRYIIPVKNIIGDPVWCIIANNIQYLDSAGNILCEDVSGYSLGQVAFSDYYFDSYVEKDSIGYFPGIDKVDYDAVKSLRIKKLSSGGSGVRSEISVIPTSYHCSHDSLLIKVENRSNQEVNFSYDYNYYIIFGDNGKPIDWSFYHGAPQKCLGKGSFEVYGSSFYGSATRIMPFIDFEPNDSLKSCQIRGNLNLSKPEDIKCLHDMRNQKIKGELDYIKDRD